MGMKRFHTGFGVKLREMRIKQGLTQAEVAEAAGMKAQTIEGYRKIERGQTEPHWCTVLKLCEALGCSPDDFVMDRPAKNPPTYPHGRPPANE